MKFTSIIFTAGLAAAVSAATTATAPAPQSTPASSYTKQQESCLDGCSTSDVSNYSSCRATCLGNPSPNQAMAIATTKCSTACSKGEGTASDTKAYGECLRKCAVDNYLPGGSGSKINSQIPDPGAAGTPTAAKVSQNPAMPAASSSPSKSSKTPSKSYQSSSPSASESSSSSASSSSSEPSSSASSKPTSGAGKLVASGTIIVALVAAVFVL